MDRRRKYIAVVVAGLILLACAAAAYSDWRTWRLKNVASGDGSDDTAALVTKVGRLIALPEGEDPTVATVTDPARLAGQPFFAKAKTGDKVLVYTVAKKAYLYDPAADKLLEVAPLNLGVPSAE